MPSVGSSSSVRHSVTDYCGPYVYEDSLLSRINLEGGYLSYTDIAGNRLADPEYHYYLTDHLGNNRVDLTDDGGVWQAMDYYPFGMPMGSSYLPGAQRWLFGGKELDRTSGLDLYDQEARAYDPTLGRFRNPDPLADTYYPISCYAFCADDPINLCDPTGEFLETLWDIGNVIYDAVAAGYNHIKGDHETAKEHWVDAGADLAAAVIPFVPAGTTKIVRTGEKVAKAVQKTSKKNGSSNNNSTNSKESPSKTKLKEGDPGTVTFIQGKKDKAVKRTVKLPEGYHIVKNKRTSKGQKIYYNKKKMITSLQM